MDGLWYCDKCGEVTGDPYNYRFCSVCDNVVKDLEKKLEIAINGLKRVKRIAFPRPKVTDMIDRYLKRL